MIPVIGDLIDSTVGKAVGNTVNKLIEHYLPASLSGAEKETFKQKARELAIEESKAATADIQSARKLAAKESEGAPGWTKVLTVTHRPVWSFLILAIFAWTVLAPYLGFPVIALTDIHKDIMQTVIIFYFGGRTVEKAAGKVWGR
ncbi:MAG: hypothetical protein V3V95_06500 [Thermodesulfobacteriota bacterium]